jgi:trimethylamine--corrinoid protein Co-methyltransferase
MVSEKNMLKVLEKSDLEAIHGATLKVLGRTGIMVNSDETLGLLASSGFSVDRKTKIVKMPEDRVMEAVKKCEHNFKWHARSEKHTVDVVDGRTKIGPGSQCLFYIDPETDQVRQPLLKDGIMVARLLDALDSASIAYVPVHLSDVPDDAQNIVQMAAGLLNSSKLTMGGSADRADFELTLKIADALLGDREILRKKALFTGYIDPISPLGHDHTMLEVLLGYSSWNLPVFVTVMALAGGTAPASLAGLLVQLNAEVLSSVAIAACVTRNPKIIYGSVSCPLDMRSGIASTGSPEFALIGVGAIQMAKFYGMPSNMGVQSDSKMVDSQTSYEKTQAALMAMMAGADFSDLFLGSTEAFNVYSPVQAVIDDEIASSAMRIARGIEVNDQTLAVDVIAKTGPMGNYLKRIETLRQFKKEHMAAKLSDRATRQQWVANGSKDTKRRAKERMIELVNSHTPEPLETEIKKKIDNLIHEYSKSFGADALEKRD